MRRRFVWIQGKAQEAIFYFLYQAPDGYYVVDAAGNATFAAPLSNAENPTWIRPEGFTVTGPNDWRFCARGRNGSDYNILFYGPSGLVYTTPSVSDFIGTFTGSGLITNAYLYTIDTTQAYWYTHLGTTGNGPNVFPDINAPGFVLPNVQTSDSLVDYRINHDMTWAVNPDQLIKSDGTIIPIISGTIPLPWPSRIRHSFVGLTLYKHLHPDTNITSVATTPYTYDPDTGTATEGAAFSTSITPPDPTWTHLYTRYWPT